jgi:hypothetical protein
MGVSITGHPINSRSAVYRDVHALLCIVEHALSESMYIKDIVGAVQAG